MNDNVYPMNKYTCTSVSPIHFSCSHSDYLSRESFEIDEGVVAVFECKPRPIGKQDSVYAQRINTSDLSNVISQRFDRLPEWYFRLDQRLQFLLCVQSLQCS